MNQPGVKIHRLLSGVDLHQDLAPPYGYWYEHRYSPEHFGAEQTAVLSLESCQAVLDAYAPLCPCTCHQGSGMLHYVACCGAGTRYRNPNE